MVSYKWSMPDHFLVHDQYIYYPKILVTVERTHQAIVIRRLAEIIAYSKIFCYLLFRQYKIVSYYSSMTKINLFA
jgi:hypothetical protein